MCFEYKLDVTRLRARLFASLNFRKHVIKDVGFLKKAAYRAGVVEDGAECLFAWLLAFVEERPDE